MSRLLAAIAALLLVVGCASTDDVVGNVSGSRNDITIWEDPDRPVVCYIIWMSHGGGGMSCVKEAERE